MLFRMRKLSIPSAGGYEKLTIIDAQDPTPKQDEVLIDVKGIGVNYADILVRLGVYSSAKTYVGWPITPGFEVSGIIRAVGSQVKNHKVGDEVVAFTRFNGYSTALCVHERYAMKLPRGFNLMQAAGFPAVFMTAFYALKQIFILRPQSKILIHSAAGGVGSALIQIAKAEGHFVVGVVGSSHKVEYVKSLGADIVIDKSTDINFWQTLNTRGLKGQLDVVYDANGYTTISQGYEFLKPTGKLVVYGSHSLLPKVGGRINWFQLVSGYLKTKRFNPLDLVTDNKGLIGFNVSYLFEQEEMVKENMAGLAGLADSGKIYPFETTFIPFEKLEDAHRLIESGTSRGKIVLTV